MLIVSPRQYKTSSVVISDSGMVRMLIKATRHSKRNNAKITMTSTNPSTSACGQVVNRGRNEVRLLKDRGVELHSRQTRLQRPDRFLDALGHLNRVRPGQLLDDEQQTGTVIDHRIADQRLMIFDDTRDIADLDVLCRHPPHAAAPWQDHRG